MLLLETAMTTTYSKTFSAAVLALTLTACSSVPQNGVIATDMGGTFSNMWSNVFTGKLRAAPNQQYAFGGTDATLNTQRLINRTSVHASAQPHYNYSQPQSRIQPRAYPAQRPVQMRQDITPQIKPQIKQSKTQGFGSRLRSIFNPSSNAKFERNELDGYENTPATQSAALPKPTAAQPSPPPAQSQPVVARTQTADDAYPVQKTETNVIPARASINDNLAKTGRQAASYQPDIPANWESANQEIGDSLSYVKMGGGSKISDWQACEKQAGGYFNTTSTGFIVEPKFDSCMRGAGYKPESEAQAELSASAQ